MPPKSTMPRVIAVAAMFALAAPTLAAAQTPPPGHGKPPPHGAPRVVPRGGPIHPGPGPGPRIAAPIHPGPGRAGPWVFHGHSYAWHPVHFPRPWVYPPGFAYRLWAVGAVLPPIFWSTPTYYYTDWATMGLPPPDPGFQYVEYGPDLLLVNVSTGEVVQVFPGAFS
jgi:Nickel/cobalt transporter regulator